MSDVGLGMADIEGRIADVGIIYDLKFFRNSHIAQKWLKSHFLHRAKNLSSLNHTA